MTPTHKSLVFACCVLLSACGSKKAAPVAGSPAPTKAADGTSLPKSITSANPASAAEFLLPSTLVSTKMLFSRVGLSFLPNDAERTTPRGYVCMTGETKKELIPNAVRYTLETSIVEYASGADGELWNRYTISLRAIVATSKTVLISPDFAEGYKNISAKEFEEKCGTQYVASTYNGAIVASSITYDVAAAEAVPTPVTVHVNGNDAEKIRQLGEMFEGLVSQAKSYKTAKHFEKTGQQSPLLVNGGDETKDMKLIETMTLFTQKVSQIKTPFEPSFLGLVEVAPYPIVTR